MIGQEMSSLGQQLNVINTADVYDDGFLRIEHKSYYIACGGELLKLARGEFLVVSLLAQNTERYVSTEAIWHYVWQGKKPFNKESLTVIVCGLRRIFEPFGIRIETMFTFGYKLMPVRQNKI